MAANKEEEEVKKDDFTAREYQERLAEMAIERNKIIFLPTGSGKTFISTLVITHFLKKNECANKKLGEGGKRAFFLVNTVALVQQQVKQIENRAPFYVKGYSGDMGVDHWSKDSWNTEFERFQILVMTAQIFLNLLLERIITLKDAAVVVFDECHHGVTDHPMRQIMQQFGFTSVNEQPRVLGLTATLLNKNVPVNKVKEEIRILETTYLSQIATADDENMVKMYSTNPRLFKLDYNTNIDQQRGLHARQFIFGQLQYFIKNIQLNTDIEPDRAFQPVGTMQIDGKAKKTNKELKNVLVDIEVNMEELGLYGGYVAVLARIIQMQKMIFHCEKTDITIKVFQSFMSSLCHLRKAFEVEMQGKTEFERIRQYSTNKVLRLFDILKKIKEDDHTIVFVKRRFTAKIMHTLVANAAKVMPKLKHIKTDFVVGYNVANPFKDTRENLLQRHYNDQVLRKFNAGLVNVLFGSNVVEEGMDVSKCNKVIMFDAPLDFRSYTQSKGRARHKDSEYIMLVNDPRYNDKLYRFKEVEEKLQDLLCGGSYKERTEPSLEEADATLFATIPGLEPYKPFGNDGPSITALSAITHINRYFLSLKRDKFTTVTPYWYLKSQGNMFKCYLRLPMESKINETVEGTLQQNKENAKRSVALEACKLLHRCGELDDDHLLPITIAAKTVSSIGLLPHWDPDETFEYGKNKKKRLWKKEWPKCLTGCMPTPKTQVYLHVLELKAMYSPPPDNQRLVAFQETLLAFCSYAIVSTKRLPKLAPFPVYMSTGEMEVNVLDGKPHSFNDLELKKISEFHGTIFDNVLQVVNTFLIRDYSNTQNSYLIAPVILGSKGVEIDWDVIEKANMPFPNPEKRPKEDARKTLVINEENYLRKIVTPWYRTVPAQKYIVTNVCHDMSENSAFPSDIYKTYKDYFADKYKIEPLIHQPLLEVRAISSRLNYLKPMTLTKALRRQNKEDNEEFEVWLVPEFCYVYPMDGRYWLKALLLPSVLHRIAELCAAEELRVRLVRDTGIGMAVMPTGRNPKKLEADASLAKEIHVEVTQLLTPLSIQLNNQDSVSRKSKPVVWQENEEPLDIDRAMDQVTLFDVMYYDEFVNEPLCSNLPKGNKFIEDTRKPKPKFVTPPPLNMLKKKEQGFGPEQIQILQAITAASANDLINCERLETLGDSFLKFSISLVLFETQEDVSEGVLTSLKGQMVGNKNLFFCGKAKQLGNILQVRDFSPQEDWVPPQFCVEHTILGTISAASLDPSCLYNMVIPKEEMRAGRLSHETKERLAEILYAAEDRQNQSCTFTNDIALTDKNISDAVEAILGVYLENSGVFGALRVMNWFEVIDPYLAIDKLFTDKITSPTRGTRGLPSDHLVQPHLLEELLNYKFRDRAYMLQALTHPSYHNNNITQCYQRLEFLGDAIIDFLITVHIYERCVELHPGDLTDLRSALVNNITLGCITVRHGLQRFLLHRSSQLSDIMSRFVRHQEERSHKIDNDVLFLLEEEEIRIAECIEVPKALGDVFESLVGAIYLDSGKDLDVTWKVVYNLMKSEIENFHADVPKNHVRMLYESTCKPEFSSGLLTDGVVQVTVEIIHEGKKVVFHGFADNKLKAKRAAAKQALRMIRGSLLK